MVKSMFAGVASVRTHQSKFDVTSNNIANVNTWGFKAASMSFKDTMYQSTSAGSAGNTGDGGYVAVNPNQVGYGVTTGSISYDFSTGGRSPSASGLDCMIDGTGFFLVGPMKGEGGKISLDTDDAIKSSGLFLSRVGKFKVDPNGYLVDDGGNYVYGFANNKLNGDPEYNKGTLSPLKIPTKSQMADVAGQKSTSELATRKKELEEAIANYNTANVLLGSVRNNYFGAVAAYDDSKLKTLTTELESKKKAMDAAYDNWKDKKDSTTEGLYKTAKDEYDKKNVEVIMEQAKLRCPKTLTSSSSSQTELDAYNNALAAFNADPTNTTLEADLKLKEKALYDKQSAPLATAIKEYNDAFDALQKLDPTTDAALYKTANETLTTKKAALDKVQTTLAKIEDDSPKGKLDAAELAVASAEAKVKVADQLQKSAENEYKNAQQGNTTSKEKESGSTDDLEEFANYKIQEDGTIVGTSKDSVTVTIGKIALGGVANTGGLEKQSGYYYSIGSSAGNVSVTEGGGTEGKILSNYLEMATVDLATEMTDMITTQRGYQAGTKIITVTDQMLEELVNMKR